MGQPHRGGSLGRRSSGWGGVPSAAFLTGCIAVHAEAVPPRGADGLHGLRVALAAQSSLNKNAREPCLLTANRPTTCPQKPVRAPPAPHSIGHPAAPAAGGVSGTGVGEQGTGRIRSRRVLGGSGGAKGQSCPRRERTGQDAALGDAESSGGRSRAGEGPGRSKR